MQTLEIRFVVNLTDSEIDVDPTAVDIAINEAQAALVQALDDHSIVVDDINHAVEIQDD